MPDVSVTFSAQIGQLISGIGEAKSAIESVGDSVSGISSKFNEFAGLVGVAFSVDGIKHFIEDMAALGERTTSLAATLGTSTEEIGRIDAIAKGTGTSTEALAKGLEIFQSNLQKAVNPTSQQAAALHALGLSAKDFIGLPLDAQLDKFSDAVSRFADGGNKLAAVRALFGRLGDDLIPTFDKGSAGFRELAEMAERAGTALSSSTAGAFEETEVKLTELGLSFQGLGIRIFQEMKPAVDAAAASLTKFVESIDSSTIENAMKGVATTVIDVLERISEFFVEVTADFDKLVARLGSFDLKRMALNTLDPNFGNLFLGADKNLDTELATINATMQSRLAAIKNTAAQFRDAVSSFTSRQTGGGGPFAGAPTASGAGLPQVSSFGVNKDAMSGQIKAIQQQIDIQNQAYQSQVEQINSAAKTFQLNEQEKTQALIVAVRTRVSAVEDEIKQEIALYKASGKDYSALTVELTKTAQKGAEDIVKIQDQASQQYVKEWEGALAPLQSAFDSQLRKILSGTETFGQAMKNVFADLVLDAIKQLEKLAVEKAAVGSPARSAAVRCPCSVVVETPLLAAASIPTSPPLQSRRSSPTRPLLACKRSRPRQTRRRRRHLARLALPAACPVRRGC